MRVKEAAACAGISSGMLSKIEHGLISPSLNTLQSLTTALELPMTDLFRSHGCRSAVAMVKAGDGINVSRRGTRAGHHYKLLGYIDVSNSGIVVEPYLVTLAKKTDAFPRFQHSGMEFLHMLSGEIVYGHGKNHYRMSPGDSLLFDADIPHGPDELVELPIRFLSVIVYRRDAEAFSLRDTAAD